MEVTTTMVSLSELRKILSAVAEHKPRVNIRYRTLGQLWYPNFLRVVKTEGERAILFHDAAREKFIALADFTRIIQFELDDRLFSFEPGCHYQVSENY